jgi:hypothetical protein
MTNRPVFRRIFHFSLTWEDLNKLRAFFNGQTTQIA